MYKKIREVVLAKRVRGVDTTVVITIWVDGVTFHTSLMSERIRRKTKYSRLSVDRAFAEYMFDEWFREYQIKKKFSLVLETVAPK